MELTPHPVIDIHHVLFQLFGLIPFKCTRFSIIIFHIYSITFVTAISWFYLKNTLYAEIKVKYWFDEKTSELTRFFVKSFNITCVVVVSLVYFNQNVSYRRQIDHAAKMSNLFRQINESCSDNLRYRKSLRIFLFFGVFINVLAQIMIALKYNMTTKFEHQFDILFTVLPNMVVQFVSDWYMGGMLMMAAHFRLINTEVKRILTKATRLTREAESRDNHHRKYLFMQDFCDLSDRLDRMAMLHRSLKTCVGEFNKLYQL